MDFLTTSESNFVQTQVWNVTISLLSKAVEDNTDNNYTWYEYTFMQKTTH